MFQDNCACELAYCAYDKVAEGYGGVGMRIGDPLPAHVLAPQNASLVHDDDFQIVPALRSAQEVLEREKRPVCINAIIGKTSFREGSLSV